MLNMRLGALPDTEVNTPQFPPGKLAQPAQTEIGALILPHREDGEVIRPDVGRRRQTGCQVAARLVGCHEVKASIGANVYPADTSDRITGM